MAEENRNGYGHVSPEEYREKKQQERNTVFDMLSSSTQNLMNEGELMKYLDMQGRFVHLSVSNVLLIKEQNPEAVWVRTFDEWKSDNISLLKGETGIMTLDLSYYKRMDGSMGRNTKVTRLFDISQTTAADRQIEEPTYRDIPEHIAAASPVQVRLTDELPEDMNAIWSGDLILVRDDLTADQAFYYTAREIACCSLAKEKGLSRDDVLPYGECAAYILAGRHNLPRETPDTAALISHFEGMEEKDVRRELTEMKQITLTMEQSMMKDRKIQRNAPEEAR